MGSLQRQGPCLVSSCQQAWATDPGLCLDNPMSPVLAWQQLFGELYNNVLSIWRAHQLTSLLLIYYQQLWAVGGAPCIAGRHGSVGVRRFVALDHPAVVWSRSCVCLHSTLASRCLWRAPWEAEPATPIAYSQL